MAWSDRFRGDIAAGTGCPLFTFRTIEINGGPGHTFAVSSHAGLSGYHGLAAISVQGQRLMPRSWSSQLGGFSVTIYGDTAIKSALYNVARGTPVELVCSYGVVDAEAMNPIARGMVRNTRLSRAGLVIDCDDLLTALSSRIDVSGGFSSLFYSAGTTTTLTSGYTAGDATLNVASTTSFERKTGGAGAVLVTPSSGDPFYLKYTGKTGTTFTGVVATAIMGTTAANASTGAIVTEVAYLSGHPLNLARQILVSRDGTQGTWDVFPQSWGLGLSETYIDMRDIDDYKEIARVSTGSYTWEYAVPSIQTDGYAFILSLFGSAGFFPVMRQGSISFRCGVAPESDVPAAGILDPADMMDGWELSGYDSDHSPEYQTLSIATFATPTGYISGSTSAATLPASANYPMDLSDRVFDNDAAITTEMLNRLTPYYTRIPERLTGALAGFKYAHLAPGDRLDITSDRILTRSLITRGQLFRRALVDEVQVYWDAASGASTRLGVLVYPADEQEAS